MTHQIKNPPAVKELLEKDPEWTFVDVRTVEEFDQGHVPGAYNVPIAFKTAFGMQPNPEFLAVMKRLFGKDRKLVFG